MIPKNHTFDTMAKSIDNDAGFHTFFYKNLDLGIATETIKSMMKQMYLSNSRRQQPKEKNLQPRRPKIELTESENELFELMHSWREQKVANNEERVNIPNGVLKRIIREKLEKRQLAHMEGFGKTDIAQYFDEMMDYVNNNGAQKKVEPVVKKIATRPKEDVEEKPRRKAKKADDE